MHITVHAAVERQEGAERLSTALSRIDTATDRLCLVIESMPSINDKGKSTLILAMSWYSADVKGRIANSMGMEFGWRDFLARGSSGALLRRSPNVDEEVELGTRIARRVRRYIDKLDRISDRLEPKYADEPLIMRYLRKVSVETVRFP